MPAINVYELIRTAEAVEQEAEQFYRGLERRFEQQPGLACFWHLRAMEELMHVRWLTQIGLLLNINALDEPVEPGLAKQVYQAAGFSAQRALARVHNAEEAYQVAVALEQAEIGELMDCLFKLADLDAGLPTLFRRQIRNHQERVISGMPAMYDRRAIWQRVIP